MICARQPGIGKYTRLSIVGVDSCGRGIPSRMGVIRAGDTIGRLPLDETLRLPKHEKRTHAPIGWLACPLRATYALLTGDGEGNLGAILVHPSMRHACSIRCAAFTLLTPSCSGSRSRSSALERWSTIRARDSQHFRASNVYLETMDQHSPQSASRSSPQLGSFDTLPTELCDMIYQEELAFPVDLGSRCRSRLNGLSRGLDRALAKCTRGKCMHNKFAFELTFATNSKGEVTRRTEVPDLQKLVKRKGAHNFRQVRSVTFRITQLGPADQDMEILLSFERQSPAQPCDSERSNTVQLRAGFTQPYRELSLYMGYIPWIKKLCFDMLWLVLDPRGFLDEYEEKKDEVEMIYTVATSGGGRVLERGSMDLGSSVATLAEVVEAMQDDPKCTCTFQLS